MAAVYFEEGMISTHTFFICRIQITGVRPDILFEYWIRPHPSTRKYSDDLNGGHSLERGSTILVELSFSYHKTTTLQSNSYYFTMLEGYRKLRRLWKKKNLSSFKKSHWNTRRRSKKNIGLNHFSYKVMLVMLCWNNDDIKKSSTTI